MEPNSLKFPFKTGIHLEPDEHITRIVYRHFIDVIPGIAIALFLECFSLGLMYLMGRSPQFLPFPAGAVFMMVWVTTLLAIIIFLINLYVYGHNILVFTNIHLIQIVQNGLFYRRVSQLSFLNVQDVTGVKTGILETVFDYGDVEVQSAGEQEKFIFHNASNPEELADSALQTHEECLRAAAQQGVNPQG